MDYCSPCRRHLNGAVSCPGCGTPAEDLGLPSATSDTAQEGGADTPAPRAERRAGRRARETSPASGATRASRRKPKPRLIGSRARRARRGRGRRVTIMAAVLGPVLAAVFVAELATEGHWRESSPSPSRQEPVADRSGGVPDSDDPVTQDTSGPSEPPSASDGGQGEDKDASRDKDRGKDDGKSEDDKDDTSSDPDGDSSSDPSDATSSAPGGPGTTQGPTTPSHPGPTAPATVAPTPTPSPSETCDRFLWWCT
ncbi:SCO2400 family protein [Streptomyces antimycoticus]|uniref:SCO2400 family protein n=1 Tax=Streptomyces antimycoticus TaxID=68175 RepID=UPI000A3CF4E1